MPCGSRVSDVALSRDTVKIAYPATRGMLPCIRIFVAAIAESCKRDRTSLVYYIPTILVDVQTKGEGTEVY